MNSSMRSVLTVLTVCLLTLGTALAGGNKLKGKGVVTFRTGEILTVKTAEGPVTVMLTGDTKVLQPVGLGARHKDMPAEVIIPGLKLSYEGTTDDQGSIMATRIEFESDDLALAEVIQAGLNPTAQQQAANMETFRANKEVTDAAIPANRQMIDTNKAQIAEVQQATNKRFSELTDWVAMKEIAVHFRSGDYTLDAEHRKELDDFAQQAVTQKGYVIEVRGFADSRGAAADNEMLSKNRAEAVVAYLLQNCQVPVKNIVAPGAMSETHPVASNETRTGRAENRRVTLRLLVSKGVAGVGGN